MILLAGGEDIYNSVKRDLHRVSHDWRFLQVNVKFKTRNLLELLLLSFDPFCNYLLETVSVKLALAEPAAFSPLKVI